MRIAVILIAGVASLRAELPAGYAGSQACAGCHREIYRKQIESNHARALRPIRGSPLEGFLKANPIRERGGYSLVYEDAPSALDVIARAPHDEAKGILEWVFGTGQVGMTPVGRFADGRYFEHRVSYYAEAKTIGITPGQPVRPSSTAAAAIGAVQSGRDIYACFNCHSTGLKEYVPDSPLDVQGMQPGIQCERCHGPGQAHVDAAMRGAAKTDITRAIFRLPRLPVKTSVEFCGQCHRLPDPKHPDAEPERVEPISVRFQPMGLLASRCFKESKNLSCVTCHNPHANAIRNDAAYYSAKCMSCHPIAVAKTACPRTSASDCLACHMRRSSPYPHFAFTDHRIRIYRP